MSALPKKIVVHEGSDNLGRYVYTAYRWALYTPGHPDGEYVPRWRGQVYHAALPDWIDEAEEA